VHIEEKDMPQTVSVSLSKFTASVQSAVQEAVAKHPKFSFEVPKAVSISYLIRGIPVPDTFVGNVSLAESQAFATDVATRLAGPHPELFPKGVPVQGALFSVGKHLIVGIPPMIEDIAFGK
jgi:hypothetical protein